MPWSTPRLIASKKKKKYVLNLKKHKCFWSVLRARKQPTIRKVASQRVAANVRFKAGLVWLGAEIRLPKGSSRGNFLHRTLMHKGESYKTFLTKAPVGLINPALKLVKRMKLYIYYKSLNLDYGTVAFFNEKSLEFPRSTETRLCIPGRGKWHQQAPRSGYLVSLARTARRKPRIKRVRLYQSSENFLFFQKRHRALLKKFWKRRLILLGYSDNFEHFASTKALRIGYPYSGVLRKGWNRIALGTPALSHLLLMSQTLTAYLASLTGAWLVGKVQKRVLGGKKSLKLSHYHQNKLCGNSFFGARRAGTTTSWPLRLNTQISAAKSPRLVAAPRSSNRDHFIAQAKNLSYITYLLSAPLIFKYFWSKNVRTCYADLPLALWKKQRFGRTKFFAEIAKANLAPLPLFQKVYRRRVLRLLRLKRFLPNTIIWSYLTLVRFIELLTGKYVYLKFNPFVQTSLSFLDLARCQMWEGRVGGFKKALGPRIFLNESIQIIYLAIKFKDPTFLTNWIDEMLTRIKFWSYRQIFRYLKYVLKVLLRPYFSDLGFKGLKLKLKGKIAVAGNARTRTLFYRIGETSHATMDNRVHQAFRTFETFTGVLGFRLWFFF